MIKNPINRNFGIYAVAAAVFFAPSLASAAGTGATGIDASFTTMLGDLNTMLGGNFGALMLLVSLIIGIGVYTQSAQSGHDP